MASREGIEWILEADIQAYFDSLDRSKLLEMLRIRVADEPLLGNVYLHYVLDTWFEQSVRPRRTAYARLVRYADDFVMGFKSKEDAECVMVLLTQRMAAFGLALHPDKTRLVPFGRPRRTPSAGKGPASFDFLGFTLYWRRTRKAGYAPGVKTRKARLQRALKALGEHCRRHRHDSLKEQHAALTRRVEGHLNYFGVNGNTRALSKVVPMAKALWHKWLNRRSQRRRLNWQRFNDLLQAFPLPKPTIRVRIWERTT
jgi:hypothetical protein